MATTLHQAHSVNRAALASSILHALTTAAPGTYGDDLAGLVDDEAVWSNAWAMFTGRAPSPETRAAVRKAAARTVDPATFDPFVGVS